MDTNPTNAGRTGRGQASANWAKVLAFLGGIDKLAKIRMLRPFRDNLKVACELLLGLTVVVVAGCGGRKEPPASAPSASSAKPDIAAKPVAVAEITKKHPYVNSLGMKFVPLGDTGDQMCIWETRVQDFVAFLKATGQQVKITSPGKELHPASGVSWNDATAFCAWLTEKEQKEGRIGPRDRYRLPKDREWSIAAGDTRYAWGDNWPKAEERVQLPGFKPSSGDHTAPVGSFPPSAMGFHDISGNVFEWCMDWYSMDMNPSELRLEFERLTFDGKGSTYKVLRGASWVFFDSLNLVSGYRYFNTPDARGILYGFRCLLDRNALGQGQPAQEKLPAWNLPVADARMIAGRELYRGSCVECHQYYDPTLYPDADWDRWLGRMKGKAKLNDKDFAAVAEFTNKLRERGPGVGAAMAVR